MSGLKNLIEQARTWPRFLLAADSIILGLWRLVFAADGPPLLHDGLYEVAVSLELPHVEDSAIKPTEKFA